MPSKDECVAAAAARYGQAIARRDAKPVEQAARDAYRPGGPLIDELERRIRRQREDGDAPNS